MTAVLALGAAFTSTDAAPLLEIVPINCPTSIAPFCDAVTSYFRSGDLASDNAIVLPEARDNPPSVVFVMDPFFASRKL
jgi:hypothetical protein